MKTFLKDEKKSDGLIQPNETCLGNSPNADLRHSGSVAFARFQSLRASLPRFRTAACSSAAVDQRQRRYQLRFLRPKPGALADQP
jgi:hypothetical protein